jgi:hypothetical protein
MLKFAVKTRAYNYPVFREMLRSVRDAVKRRDPSS